MRASSGKSSKRISMKRHNKAGQLFRNLAQSNISSKYIALGSFGRRIRARRGPGVAHKAVARKIATYYYRVMTKGVEFVEQAIENYEKFLKEVQIKHLHKLAKKHNFELVEIREEIKTEREIMEKMFINNRRTYYKLKQRVKKQIEKWLQEGFTFSHAQYDHY
jgi:hypothetical protein